MFNILNFIMGKSSVNKTKEHRKINDVKDGGAVAAPTKSLTKHLEEEHGALSQRGFTDNKGNWCVTEMIIEGVGKHFEIPEEAKLWEKKFAFVKFANDTIIVNEKEEK